jgi:hypothetical protein
LKEKATSAALIGVPSLNFTPLRIVNVRTLLPSLHAQPVASHGVALAFSRVSTNASGSYTWPMVMPRPVSLGLYGLKLQFHCEPLSLSSVSVPLGPLADEPDDPDGADDPQAATAAAMSTAAPVTIRRLIPLVLP